MDEAACQKYKSLPAGPLRSLVDISILHLAGSGKESATCATVRMLPSGDCPFLSAERLCRIQVEHGASYLSHTCATFPRAVHRIDGLKEIELSLSCPEAARLVLLEPRLLPPVTGPAYAMKWDETQSGQTSLRTYFWQIRELIVTLIQNRRYPLWQRLFLLGTFSRRLDAVGRGEVKRSVPDLLCDFSGALTADGLSASMDSISANLRLQLEVVLRFIARRVNNSPVRSGLREVIGTFTESIGRSQGASLESQVANYADAYTQVYAPFFHRHPHVLENYLLNAVLRDLYPFGAQLGDPQARPEPTRAFAMLAIRFALIKGLLIGVAGARRSNFSLADVVRTVQTAFRHFEHNQKFLAGAYKMLSARGLDDARGLTMLLRN